MYNIKNYKITPEQLCEIESSLQLAAHILNREDVPDWEDLQTACRQICDVRQNLQWIREKSEKAETWRDDADKPYLKATDERKVEKVGNFRI